MLGQQRLRAAACSRRHGSTEPVTRANNRPAAALSRQQQRFGRRARALIVLAAHDKVRWVA